MIHRKDIFFPFFFLNSQIDSILFWHTLLLVTEAFFLLFYLFIQVSLAKKSQARNLIKQGEQMDIPNRVSCPPSPASSSQHTWYS